MSIAKKFIREIFRMPATKQLVFAGVFTLALAGSVALGMASRGMGSAQVDRDCSHDSIDYAAYPSAGDCGAATAQELIADIKNNNPSDLQSFYANFGLTAATYDQFANTAQEGTVNRDGTVKLNDGTVVMTGVDTYGRESWGNPNRKAINIAGNTYYHAAPSVSFGKDVNSIPVLIMFDNNGQAQVVVEKPCGNEVTGTSVQNSVACKALQATQPDATHKPNTYNFTTDVTVAGNAHISRVVYHFTDDNTTITKTGLDANTQPVLHTFAQSGDVTVTVYASVPGGKEIPAVAVANCQKHITYVAPFFVCTNLIPIAIDDAKKSFRFTVTTKTDTTGQTVLENVDFTLDGKDTTKAVTTKDNNGNVYKEYTFTDDVEHKVVASVNFNTAQGVQSASCQASVTPAKTPKCTVPGHETEAPNSPTCGYCQPNIPIGDTRCTPPPAVLSASTTKLVNTGPGDVVGLFVGVITLGFFGHQFVLRRKARRAATSEVA